MVYYFLAFELSNLTATEESLVDCYKKKRWSVWKSKSTQAMAVKRQRLCSQVSLCRLQQREENVLVDELACVGAQRSQKRSVLTSKPVQAMPVKRKSLCRRVGRGRSQKPSAWMKKLVWAMSVKRKCSYGQVGLCSSRERLESICICE